jgi:hypothetical protein
VPQFLVDAFVAQEQARAASVGAALGGASAAVEALRPPSVVVTQPRRVAALALAKRVAEERGEAVGRGEVGHQVRLDRRVDRKLGAIEFVTVGVLLRRLGDAATAHAAGPAACGDAGDELLDGLTHIIVDEVGLPWTHRRICDTTSKTVPNSAHEYEHCLP